MDSLAHRRDDWLDNINGNINENAVYIETDNRLKQKIQGNPDLSNIITICIGIRNPDDFISIGTNDGLNKSAKIWIY